ncbi:flavin reductase family protein [Agromyces sp. Marseille-P2726]|uniref:flavin reductase family protein n=1 Tax=Agromyces sp. Marseille-P2726 TaxID=2709132 RepID=UPI001C2DC49A|nr:flavin reductase family protein [Agromyces sp. Marseille-P2726]
MSAEPQSGVIAPRLFRDVLGHFPTGVAVITSVGDDGQPIGMAVGSFTSVSLDPPLVAFLPDRGSSTFPAIRNAGRFCVNVLAGGQEDICRTFATRGADRFGSVEWRPAPHTGSPVLDGVVAWIDCELGDVHEAGDHDIVIGRVLHLEVANPTLPLLFFQGGYGTFAPRSLVMASRGRPSEAVRAAEAARDDLERLAEEVGLECRVLAREENGLAIVATAGHASGADPVGAILPFYPPFGGTIAAWGSPELRAEWYDSFPAELGSEQRAEFDADLDRMRKRGWTLTFQSDAATEAETLVEAMAEYGRTPSLERRLFEAGKEMSGLDDPDLLDDSTASQVRTITAPVIGANGPLLHLTLYGFPPDASLDFVEGARDVLVATSRTLSERFGGRVD